MVFIAALWWTSRSTKQRSLPHAILRSRQEKIVRTSGEMIVMHYSLLAREEIEENQVRQREASPTLAPLGRAVLKPTGADMNTR